MKPKIKRLPELIRKAGQVTTNELAKEPDLEVHKMHRMFYMQESTKSRFAYASFYVRSDASFFGFLKRLPFTQGYVLQSNITYNRGILPLQRKGFHFFHRKLMGYICGLLEFRTPKMQISAHCSPWYLPKYLTSDSAQVIWLFPNLDLIVYRHFESCLVKHKGNFFFISTYHLCYSLDKYLAAKHRGEEVDLLSQLQQYKKEPDDQPMAEILASQFLEPNYTRPTEPSTFMRLNYHLFD